VTAANVEGVLRDAQVCRLGLTDGNEPYVVPLVYGYDDEAVYFHSGPEGRKLDMLRRNNRVCLEFEADVELVPDQQACKWGVRYRSVIAFGHATILEDPEEKVHGLDLMMAHYSGRSWEYPEEAVARTTVVRVDIDSATYKDSKRPPHAPGHTSTEASG